jgi:acetyl esterase/lipase
VPQGDAPRRLTPTSEDIKEAEFPPRMPDTIMPRPKTLPPVIEDHCYLRHGDRELRARVFMPAFDGGPFPCLIELHGGGWQGGDLEDRKGIG